MVLTSGVTVDPGRCVGCGRCTSVCIRDSIVVEDGRAVSGRGDCFDCYQCVAVCPKGAVSINGQEGFEGDPVHREPVVDYGDMVTFLKERRSVRWFTGEKVTREEFERLFESARYSPTSMHRQDVEMVVVDKRLDEFMRVVYEALKPIEDTLPRIRDFCRYMEGTYENPKGHPFLWEGRQLILAFSEVSVDAVIASVRVELTGYTMGLGGFYSLFMITAAEREPELFSRFFPEIDPRKRLRCVYVIGHPRVRYGRTLPPRRLQVRYC